MKGGVSGAECRHVPSCPRCCSWPVDTGNRLVCPYCGFSGEVSLNEGARELSWRLRVQVADFNSRRAVVKSWEG